MVSDAQAPFHAHIYYDPGERGDAATLRERFAADSAVLFVGAMTDRPVGPHPLAQFEVHFRASARALIIAAIEESGLRALVHPLTSDDLADHTGLAHWIGERVALDLTMLDPPGANKGVARFGRRDF